MTKTNILVKLKKTLQTNTAMNDLYDTRLCESQHDLVSYGSFTVMLSEVFLSFI